MTVALTIGWFTEAAQAQDWPTPEGGYDHARFVGAALESDELVPIWSIETFGQPSHVLLADSDGDPAIEVLATAGGRVWAWDAAGRPEWVSVPIDANLLFPPVDIDGDGRPEIVARDSVAGITVLRGRDGAFLYASDDDDLGYVGSLLRYDFDGDGRLDLLAAEFDCGSTSHQVGRAVAWSFATPSAPVELFRLEENTRDYHCGRNLRFVQLDGVGPPEIVAFGNSQLYAYDATTGELVDSVDVGRLPFGLVDAHVVDLDDDGFEELLVSTDNAPSDEDNTRRLLLVGRDLATGGWQLLWQVGVAQPASDRHDIPPQPIADLDGNGSLEVVHSVLSGSTGQWRTSVRELATGNLIDDASGRAVAWFEGPGELLVAAADVLEIDRNVLVGDQLAQLAPSLPGHDVPHVDGGLLASGVEARRPAMGTGGRILTAAFRDPSGQPLEQPTLYASRLLSTGDGWQIESLSLAPADRTAVGQSIDGSAWLARSEPNGNLGIYDGALVPSNPGPNALPNIRTPAQNPAPVVGIVDAGDGLALGRGRERYDSNGANLANGPTTMGASHALLGFAELDVASHFAIVEQDTGYLAEQPDLIATPLTPAEGWQVDGLVFRSDEGSVLWDQVRLIGDISSDDVPDVVVQRRFEDSTGERRVQVFSGLTGDPLWASAATFPFAHTEPPIAFSTAGGPRVATAVGFVLRVHDPATGAVLATSPEPLIGGMLAMPDPASAGHELLVVGAFSRPIWRAFDGAGQLVWRQDEIYDPQAFWAGTGMAFIPTDSGPVLAEGRRTLRDFDHNMIVLDGQDGTILRRLDLSGGEVGSAGAGPARVSITGILGTAGRPPDQAPLIIAAAEDGWLYGIDAQAATDATISDDALRVWTLDLGAALGQPSAIDIDQDERAELLVPVAFGQVVAFDAPGLLIELEILDTNCVDETIDVDVIEWTDHYCLAFESPLGVDGFLVRLIDDSTGAPLATTTTTGPSARFDGLALPPGRKVRATVQGYTIDHPTISSRIFSSDGAVVVDPIAPPIIADFRAEPDRFAPLSEATRIRAELSDPSPLSGYSLVIAESGTGTPVFSTATSLNSAAFSVDLMWVGTGDDGAPLAPGDYLATLVANDFSGLSSSATIPITLVVGLPGEPDADAGQAPDASPDVTGAPDATADAGSPIGADSGVTVRWPDIPSQGERGLRPERTPLGTDGCGCRAVGASTDSSALLGLLVLAFALSFRRRVRSI